MVGFCTYTVSQYKADTHNYLTLLCSTFEPERVFHLNFMTKPTHPLANVILHARPIISGNDGTVGFFHPTVPTQVAGVKLHKEVACFLSSGDHFGEVLGLVLLSPTDVVEVSIWCLNVTILDYWSYTIADNYCVHKSM